MFKIFKKLQFSVLTIATLLIVSLGSASDAQAATCTPTDADIADGIRYENCNDGTTYPTFNRYVNYPSNSGTFDERDFFKVRNLGDNSVNYTNRQHVTSDEILRFSVRMHNDCSPNLNGPDGTGDCVAERVRALINSFNQTGNTYETDAFTAKRFTAELSASNTNPLVVSDFVDILSSDNSEQIILEYLDGTGKYYLAEEANSQRYSLFPRQLFGFNGQGSPITSVDAGTSNPNSKFFGSLGYSMFLQFDVVVKTPPPVLCQSFEMTPDEFATGDSHFFRLTTNPSNYPAEDIRWIRTRDGQIIDSNDLPWSDNAEFNADNRTAIFHDLRQNDIVRVEATRNFAEGHSCFDEAIPEPEETLEPVCRAFTMTPTEFVPGEETTFDLTVQPNDFNRDHINWEVLLNGHEDQNMNFASYEETPTGVRATFDNLTEDHRIYVTASQDAAVDSNSRCNAQAAPVSVPDITPCEDLGLTTESKTFSVEPNTTNTFEIETLVPADFDGQIIWAIVGPNSDNEIVESQNGRVATIVGLSEDDMVQVSAIPTNHGASCKDLSFPETEELSICTELTLTPESKTFVPVPGHTNRFEIGTLIPDDFDGEIVWEVVGPSSDIDIYRSQDNHIVEMYDLTAEDIVRVTAIPAEGDSCTDEAIPEEPKVCTELSLSASSRTFSPNPEDRNRFAIDTLLPEDFDGTITWEVVAKDANDPIGQAEAAEAQIGKYNNNRNALIIGLTSNVEVLVSADPAAAGACEDRAVAVEIPQTVCRDLALTRGSKTFIPEPTAENSFAINIDPTDFPADQIQWYSEPALPVENFVLSGDHRAAVITGLTIDHIVYVTATPLAEDSTCLDFAIPKDEPPSSCTDLDIFNINVNTDEQTALFDFETVPAEYLDRVVLQVISGPNTGIVEDLGGQTGRLRYFTSEAVVAAYVPGEFEIDLENGTFNGCYDSLTIKDETKEEPCKNLDLYPDTFIPGEQCTDFVINTDPSDYPDYTIEPSQNVVSQQGNRYTLCNLNENDQVTAYATGDIAPGASCKDIATPRPPEELVCTDAFISPRSFSIEPGVVNTFDLNVLPGDYNGAFRWYTSPGGIGEFQDGFTRGGTITTTNKRVTFRLTQSNVQNAQVFVEAVDPRFTAICRDQAQGTSIPDVPGQLGKTEIEGKLFVTEGENVTYRISFEPNSYMSTQDLQLIDTASIFNGRIPGEIDGNLSPYNSAIEVDPSSIKVDGIARCFPNQPLKNCYTGDFLNSNGLTLHQYQGRRITITYSGVVNSGLTAEACSNTTPGSDRFCGEHYPNTVTVVVPEPLVNPNPEIPVENRPTYTITDSYRMSVLCPAFRGFGFGDIILEDQFKGGIDTLSCGDRPNVPGIVIKPDLPTPIGTIPRTGENQTEIPQHGECRVRDNIDNVFDTISSTLCELESELSEELTSEPLARIEQNTEILCSNTSIPSSISIKSNADLETYRNQNNTNELVICAENITLGNGDNLELDHDGNITIIAKNDLTIKGNVTYQNNRNHTTSLVATAGGELVASNVDQLHGIYIVLPGNNSKIDPVTLNLKNGAKAFTVLGSLIGTHFELPQADFNLIYDLGRFILTKPSVLNESLEFIQSLNAGV